MKTIGQLADLLEDAVIIGNRDTVITGIEHDSRKVQQGTLFVCIPGVHVDGHKFIPQAVAAGASAIVTTREDVEVPQGIAVLRVKELQPALDTIVPYFHDYPARKMRVVGITGTNGKTTTSYITRAILRKAGYKVGLIGTIQIMIEDEVLPIHNTTPDVVELQHTLAMMRDKGMDYVVMEVSSHALDQNRVA
ncbi:Mur ligase family protein, partial [Mitsuokella jalaludinii]